MRSCVFTVRGVGSSRLAGVGCSLRRWRTTHNRLAFLGNQTSPSSGRSVHITGQAFQRSRRLIVVAVFAAVGVTAGDSTIASAGTNLSDGICHSTEVCGYRDVDYASNVADFNSCEPDWACGIGNFSLWDYWTANTTTFNDKTSSIWHRLSSKYARWGMDAFDGNGICSYPGMQLVNMGSYNDTFSAMWTSTSDLCSM